MAAEARQSAGQSTVAGQSDRKERSRKGRNGKEGSRNPQSDALEGLKLLEPEFHIYKSATGYQVPVVLVLALLRGVRDQLVAEARVS